MYRIFYARFFPFVVRHLDVNLLASDLQKCLKTDDGIASCQGNLDEKGGLFNKNRKGLPLRKQNTQARPAFA
jgi:hypothetical protein